jgi:hypothetical protein
MIRRSALATLIAGGLLVSGCERKSAAEQPIAQHVEPSKTLEPWETVDESFKGCELG